MIDWSADQVTVEVVLEPPPEHLRAIVGAAAAADLARALRNVRDQAHALEHLAAHGTPACSIAGDAYAWCAAQPAGGVTYCVDCGRPVFVPPAGEDLDDDGEAAAEIVVDHATGDTHIAT